MDAEAERLLVERVKILEDQVAQITRRDEDVRETPDFTKQRLTTAIDLMDPMTLQRVLRDVHKEIWAQAFFGLPRNSIEKLKSSVSKNSWKEIVEYWREGNHPYQSSQQEILKSIHILEEMGEIVLGPFDPTRFKAAPQKTEAEWKEFWDRQKAAAEDAATKRRAAASKWLNEELNGLI